MRGDSPQVRKLKSELYRLKRHVVSLESRLSMCEAENRRVHKENMQLEEILSAWRD